jgi:hypothetical protein
MVRQKQKQSRSKATKTTARSGERVFETDSTYFLKLVISVLLGAIWIKFKDPVIGHGLQVFGIPLGLLVGVILINRFEKHQSDRKIFYAVATLSALVCLFMPAVIYL